MTGSYKLRQLRPAIAESSVASIVTRVFSAFSLYFLLVSFVAANDAPVVVHENAFKSRTYHHVALRLVPGALMDGKDTTNPDIGYRFIEGGLFEIYLTPGTLGQMAQNCRKVTIRMPWTNPSINGSDQKIQVKKALFEQIAQLRHGARAQVEIILELDPYLSGNRTEGYELTQCLAFFRTASGAYVAHPLALR